MMTYPTINLKSVHSFFIGGHNTKVTGFDTFEICLTKNAIARQVNLNGNYEEGQMYVQYYQQENPLITNPIMLWHGGGMTGALWESTANQQPGWLNFFLQSGFNVLINDCCRRGRSGFSPKSEGNTQPLFRTKEDCWDLFRIGPVAQYQDRIAFKNSQFPLSFFDHYCRQFVIRYENNLDEMQHSYQNLVTYYPDAIIIAHSQGGGFALETALKNPQSIRAVIVIEPSGAPNIDRIINIDALKKVPHLFIWGDYIETHHVWRHYRNKIDEYTSWLISQEVPVTIMDLPKLGIDGNTHALMNDINAIEIAHLILNWMTQVIKS